MSYAKVVAVRPSKANRQIINRERKDHGFKKDSQAMRHILDEFERLSKLEQTEKAPEAPTEQPSPWSTTIYIYLLRCRGFFKDKWVTQSVCERDCQKPCEAKNEFAEAIADRERHQETHKRVWGA